MRKTKHSGQGHEDTGYSYVVIRRGRRPNRLTTTACRIGDVGRRELIKASAAQVALTELVVEDQQEQSPKQPEDIREMASLSANSLVDMLQSTSGPESSEGQTSIRQAQTFDLSGEQLEATLRQEAYSWPRVVFPPLKRNGHVVLDSCTAEGLSCLTFF